MVPSSSGGTDGINRPFLIIVLKQGTARFINLFPETKLYIRHKREGGFFFTTLQVKSPLYGETMLVSFHISKRTGINMPLGGPDEVEAMMGCLHEPTVSARSKAIYGVKNNPTPSLKVSRSLNRPFSSMSS